MMVSAYLCDEKNEKAMRHLFLFIIFALTVAGVKAQSADSLRMDSVVHDLPDLLVKGERPIARVKGSTITYDLPRLIGDRAVDNAYDAVKLLPGVVETDSKLTLGGVATTVIVDGKVTTLSADELAAQLKAMPASRIESAEVMYTAPARLQVRGSVINIRLRRKNDGDMPLTGEFNLAWNQQHDARFGERASLLYSNGKLSIDAMYLHSHGKGLSRTDQQSHHSLDDGEAYDIDISQRNKKSNYGDDFRLGFDYGFAKNHTLSLVYTGQYTHDRYNTVMDGNISADNRLLSHGWLHNLRLDYQLPFALKAGAELTYYEKPERQWLNSTLPTGTMQYVANDRQKVNRYKFFLSQEHGLSSGWGLNYGAAYTTSINHSGQRYEEMQSTTGSEPDNSAIRQREDYVNVYVGASKGFGSRLSAEASLAAEYYHSPAWHQWTVYPTLTLTWLPADGHVFQLGLSTDREYPSYWSTTNFVTYGSGGYNEITGNPDLKPSTSYNARMVYVLKGKYQAVVFLNHEKDAFLQCPYQRHDRLATVYQYRNLDYDQKIGLQLAAPFRIGSWWSTRLTLIGMWMRQKDDHYFDIPYNRHHLVGVAMTNNTFTLSKSPDITLSLDGKLQSRAIQATYDLGSCQNLDASLRWQFWNQRGMLRLFCNDIFESSDIKTSINYRGQAMRMSFSCYREFGVSFTYRLGSYKEKRHEQVDTSRFK